MSEVTRVLSAIDAGDPHAAGQLLPLVYGELRKLAAQRLAQEKPGHTLDATSLVHEAYLRLLASADAATPRDGPWNGRNHFFAAAAEAMRRILIESARSKATRKRGGAWKRIDLNDLQLAVQAAPDDLLVLDETLGLLTRTDPEAARLVQLRYFAGLSVEAAGEVLGLPRSTAYERWAYARAWLYRALQDQSPDEAS